MSTGTMRVHMAAAVLAVVCRIWHCNGDRESESNCYWSEVFLPVCDDDNWHNLYPGTYTIINERHERGEFIAIMQISEIKHIFNIFMTWLIAYQVLCLITPIHYHSCTIMNVG